MPLTRRASEFAALQKLQELSDADLRVRWYATYALGEKRAASVKRMLTGAGIRGNILKTVSYGEDRASGSDESSWAHDRRVDSAE